MNNRKHMNRKQLVNALEHRRARNIRVRRTGKRSYELVFTTFTQDFVGRLVGAERTFRGRTLRSLAMQVGIIS